MPPAGYVALVVALVLCLALLELARRRLTPLVRSWTATAEAAYADGKREESLGMLSETVLFRADPDTARALTSAVMALHRRVRPLGEDRWGLRVRGEDDVVFELVADGPAPMLAVASFRERRGRLLGAVFWYKMVGRLGAAAQRQQVVLAQGVRPHRRGERLDEHEWRWLAAGPNDPNDPARGERP